MKTFGILLVYYGRIRALNALRLIMIKWFRLSTLSHAKMSFLSSVTYENQGCTCFVI